TLNIPFTGKGADGLWFTADDVPAAAYWARTYDANGFQTGEFVFNGAGADGQPITADDTVSSYLMLKLDASGNRIARVDGTQGADGIAFTGDDVPYGYSMALGIKSAGMGITYVGRGADLAWFTADDQLSTSPITKVIYDAQHRLIEYSRFSLGADALPLTADDLLLSSMTYVYDDQGVGIASSNIVAGADGIAFTADDLPGTFYSAGIYDAQGNKCSYGGAGADNIWHTADDVIKSCSHQTLDAQGRITRLFVSGGAGADGVWGSLDDYVAIYYIYSYTTLGVTGKAEMRAGADYLMGTADDTTSPITNVGRVDTFANGSKVDYYNSGVDGVWFTADDVASSIGYDSDITSAAGRTIRRGFASSFSNQGGVCCGVDALAGTADDFSSWTEDTRDAAGQPVSYIQYGGNGGGGPGIIPPAIGADGIWFTADDVITQGTYYNRVWP
ncbi:MAG: hypothetical protein ABL855_00455, partial [Sideroxydans sp.]